MSDRIKKLEIHDLTITLPPDKKIIKKIDITFEVGKVFLIVGPNGSGKSTFLRFLKGIIPLIHPAAITGRITINHKPVSLVEFWKYRHQISYLSQNPWLQVIGSTVESDIIFSLETLNLSSEQLEKRLLTISDQFNIHSLLKRSSTKLSGGELAITALASIIALDTPIVLIDEVTAFLDYKTKQLVIDRLANLKLTEKIVIIVSHQLDDFLPLAHELVIIDDGKIVAQDKPNKILLNKSNYLLDRIKITDYLAIKNMLSVKNDDKSINTLIKIKQLENDL